MKGAAREAAFPNLRSGVTERATPADWISAAYNAVLAVIWGSLLARWPYALVLSTAHTAAVAMPFLVARAPRDVSRVVRWLREVYPLLWLIAFWTELDFLRWLLHGTAHDAPIAALDRLIFGINLDAVWMRAMPAVWFSELMHLLYFAYYPAVLLPLVYVASAGRSEMLRDATLRVTLTYLSCFLIYVVFPVDGPHFLRPRFEGALSGGFFYRLVGAMQGAGDSQGCSFPSSHVAGAVTIAYVAWRWFPARVTGVLVATAVGVAVSAVYTQNHYAIDSLAGIGWALLVQLAVVPAVAGRSRLLPALSPSPIGRTPGEGGSRRPSYLKWPYRGRGKRWPG